MQDFHYNYIKDKVKMLLIDANNHMYKIGVGYVYEDFYKDKEFFGFSNYPKDFKYYNNANI